MEEEKEMRTRSVERALDILDCFRNSNELALIDIAHKTGLSSATVLRIINSLVERSYISRDSETKKYHLGSAISSLASCADRTNESIISAAKQYMDELYEKFNENIRIFVLEGDYRICIDLRESTQDIRQFIRIGDRKHIDMNASGILFLAYMTSKRREQAIGRKIEDSEFDDVYVDGYALSKDSEESGIIAISAPIFDHDGNMVAALSMSGPSYRFINKEMTEKIKSVVYYADKISGSLKKR